MVYKIQTTIRLMIETWMIVLWMIVSYPLYLPCICPVSALYLLCICPVFGEGVVGNTVYFLSEMKLQRHFNNSFL